MKPLSEMSIAMIKKQNKSNNNNWVVQKPENGMTLQDYLAEKLNASKRVAKQQIDAKVVRINGQLVWMARHKVHTNDKVAVATIVKSPTAVSARPKNIKVLFEDDYYMVVDKPRGILVNEAAISVETILREQTGIPTLQVSHRLDRDTTGCLIVSKTEEAHNAIVEVFKRHCVAKTYRTIVHGRWDATSSTIDLPVDGQRALSNIHCLQANNDASHLSVRIETGRTHQIRKHLAMARHPVLGDGTYGFKVVENPQLQKITYPLLHAVELEFEHPYLDKVMKVFSPLPQEFHRWLTFLKLSPR